MWCHEPHRMPYASYCFFYFILSYLKVEETDLTLAFMSSGHQKKTLSKPAGDGAITLEEFEKLVSSPKLRCQKTTSREEKHRPNKRGNFEVGVLIHIFLQSWVLLSYRLILFGWQSKLFFSLNYDYGEEGYGIDMFQIAQVQCLPWQSFKGSERIRLFKSWLRSHPHTHTKKKVFVFVIYVGFGVFSQWIFVRRFVDFFSESERVFQSHGDDIGISFSPMEIWPCKFHVCVTCATPSRVITMSGRRARHIINPIHRKEHTMWKYLLH